MQLAENSTSNLNGNGAMRNEHQGNFTRELIVAVLHPPFNLFSPSKQL